MNKQVLWPGGVGGNRVSSWVSGALRQTPGHKRPPLPLKNTLQSPCIMYSHIFRKVPALPGVAGFRRHLATVVPIFNAVELKILSRLSYEIRRCVTNTELRNKSI